MINTTKISILAISGSLRSNSYNRRLLTVAMEMARSEGADVTELNPKALQLPVYDEDLLENGQAPEAVLRLFEAFRAADMFLIASPEYNHSIPGGLKNALDWISTDKPSFRNKTAAILGASTGLFGTIRMQPHLRTVLSALDIQTIPQPQVFLLSAAGAFEPDGTLADKKIDAQLRLLIAKTISLTRFVKEGVLAGASAV